MNKYLVTVNVGSLNIGEVALSKRSAPYCVYLSATDLTNLAGLIASGQVSISEATTETPVNGMDDTLFDDFAISALDLAKSNSSQLSDIAKLPKLSMSTFAARTGIKNGDTQAGSYYPFCAFCHTYDHLWKNTGAIYAVEEPYTDGRTVQKVLRSTDGGVTWTVLGSVTVNFSGGERIRKIYVEPNEETIYLLRAVDIRVTPTSYFVDSWNPALTVKHGSLDIGTRNWHAASHNIDSIHDWTKATVMFAEYGGNDCATFNVWKTIDKGVNWTSVLTQTGNNGTPGSGQIRHFHTMQIDPFTGHWWLSSGDAPNQCKIWKSTDNGVNWVLMGEGSEEFRTLGFVFESDAVYWGMDSTTIGTQVSIFKSSKTDLTQRIVIGEQIENYPVYHITKTYFPRGFLIFPQHEPPLVPKGKLSVQFYNMDTGVLSIVAEFSLNGLSNSLYHGFTGEGSRYQDFVNGLILTMLTPELGTRYRHAGSSSTYTGALKATLSL